MQSPTMTAVLDRLRQSRRAAIFTHQRPDPDALGSQTAAAFLLQHLGAKDLFRVLFDPTNGPYRFLLEGPGDVVTWSDDWGAKVGSTLDTVLMVDTCTYQQTEPARAFLKSAHDKVIAIDHHLSRDDVGPMLYTDRSAAACVEILWEMMKAVRMPIKPEVAMPLMSGLVGDTGWFRFDSVRPHTHLMAADLVQHVDPSVLYERLMQGESKTKLGLMQRALAGVRWTCAERFACMLLSRQDFSETGATQSQTEYLVDMPMIVSTVEVVALMSETPDGRVRVSLRAKHEIDVNKICNKFGGGGHAKAAGCRLDGPVEEAYAKIAGAVEEALAA